MQMNLITFEMPHISQTAIRHTFITNTVYSVRRDGHRPSGARKTFVSAQIGQSYLKAYFAYKLTRPRRDRGV